MNDDELFDNGIDGIEFTHECDNYDWEMDAFVDDRISDFERTNSFFFALFHEQKDFGHIIEEADRLAENQWISHLMPDLFTAYIPSDVIHYIQLYPEHGWDLKYFVVAKHWEFSDFTILYGTDDNLISLALNFDNMDNMHINRLAISIGKLQDRKQIFSLNELDMRLEDFFVLNDNGQLAFGSAEKCIQKINMYLVFS